MLVKAVEHGEVALAGHTEDRVHALCDQGFDQGVAGKTGTHGAYSGGVVPHYAKACRAR